MKRLDRNDQLRVGRFFQFKTDQPRFTSLVYNPQRKMVADPTIGKDAVGFSRIAEDGDFYQRTGGDGPDKTDGQSDQKNPVDQYPATEERLVLIHHSREGIITNQPFRLVHLAHDIVTGVDAACAADALELGPVTAVSYTHLALPTIYSV